MYKAARLGDLPATPEELDALARVNRADIDEFKRRDRAARLDAESWARCSRSFRRASRTRPSLAPISSGCCRAFREYPVSVELRHSSWSDASVDTVELLNGFGAAWTQIDEPKFRSSIRQNQLPNVRTFYYMRLHGRNAAQWWKHGATEDRYNYSTPPRSCSRSPKPPRPPARIVKKAYLYMNNHFAAKSVANAVMIKHLTGDTIDGRVPAGAGRQVRRARAAGADNGLVGECFARGARCGVGLVATKRRARA